MTTPLRVLIVEDTADDAELMILQLGQAGLDVEWQRVETESEYLSALDTLPDVILADYALPHFDGLRALRLLKQRDLDIPLIVVSGSIGEEIAVAAMREGAQDYLLKDRLARLGPAVTRALEGKRLREKRKQAEQALRESELRFRSIVEQSTDGIVVADEQGDVIEWNQAQERLTGIARAEALGRPVWDALYQVFPEKQKTLAAYERWEASTLDFLRTGQAPWLGRLQEADIQRPDGTRRSVQAVMFPIQTDRGFQSVSICRDITERKGAEEALRENEERYRALFEAARDGIALADTDTGIILDCNQALADLVGRNRAELIGQHQAILHASSSNDTGFSPTFKQHLTNQEGQVLETQVLTATGEIREVEIKASLLYLQGRKALQGIFRDITERKRAEEAIRRRVTELTVLYESGLAFTRLLDPASIAQHIVNTLAQHMNWHHATIRQRRPGSDELELLAFNQPGLQPQDQVAVRQHMQRLVGRMGEGMSGWVAKTGQPVRAGDLTQYPQYVETFPGIRSGLYAPMKIGGEVVGVIAIETETANAFSEHNERLLTTLAAQAAVAIENARLLQAERAARRRLETLYHVGQALSSTLDFAAILDRLTDEAIQATHATHGSALVARLDLGRFERRSLRGYSAEQAERARRQPLPLNQGINGRAYHTRQVICVGDVQANPDYFPLIPETRSELAVPILHSDQVLGTLDLQSPEVDAFCDVDLDFLHALTDQVAVALINARLFEETRRRLDEMAMVSQVALVGAAGHPFDETVARATQVLGALWPNANSYSFLFLDEADQSLRPHASYFGMPPEIAADLRIPLGQDLTGWAARERQPVRVADVTHDPRYIIKTPGTVSEMVAPLVAKDRVIGVINVESPLPDAFSGDDLRLLTTLAGQLATVLEKARLDAALAEYAATLEQRVKERTAELQAANEQLRQAHEEVRRALDKERELGELKSRFVSMASHEFRTPLTSILSSAEMLEYYGHKLTEQKKVEHLHRIQASVQNMIGLLEDVLIIGRAEAGKLEFAPAPMDLMEFCHDLVEELRLSIAARHTLRFGSQGQCGQAWMDERLLRHILLNLISNACKYSPAGSAVDFDLTCQAGQAILRIQDSGIGILPEDQARLFETFHRARNVGNIPGTGLGMVIVKRSVDLHGGTIQVDSQAGVGTTVTVTLPLERVPPSPTTHEDDHEQDTRD